MKSIKKVSSCKSPSEKDNLIGKKFESLTVVQEAPPKVYYSKKGKKYFHKRHFCICELCNSKKIIFSLSLQNRTAKGCGCLKPKTTPEFLSTNKFTIWQSMINRCNNKTYAPYKRYGKIGIEVCDAWMSFKKFLGDMGEKPENYTLKRIDETKNYCKENCIWTPTKNKESGHHPKIIKNDLVDGWFTLKEK